MLSIADIHTYYGDSYVLHGISLDAEVGQVSVLMGRNGVGKTTLVRSVMGLTPPRRGSVRFRGEDITQLKTHEISRLGIGLVPQGRRIYGSLTVREHLATAAHRRSSEQWPLERIYEIFPRLEERGRQRAITLSGGEQSMLAIARALRTEPSCLLMDEPTEGLAAALVRSVIDVILDLKKVRELTMLLVIPELPVALEVADRIYVMSKGQIVYDGTPDDLLQNYEIQERYIGIGP